MHAANAWLCFCLARRLTGRTRTAWLCSLLFALHPLQLESVGWISELRGLTSGGFALLALNAFALSRQASERARARKLLAASAVSVICAMLCKPSAAVLPLVALVIDRVVFRTPWRKALAAASIWAAVALPFALITRAAQGIPAAGQSLWWQRPFIAGDALTFYLFKTSVPIDLGVDYGRTPHWVMSRVWGYLAWVVPVALLMFGYLNRRRRPITWLGALLFVMFLLPTLGLVPFAYQAYSTVADRYAYLALIGVGLIVADAVDGARSQMTAARVAATACLALALLSFNQSRYWLMSSTFPRHTIDVNPAAAFAYNNLGDAELANGDLDAALADYRACVERDPTRVMAQVNLAEVYTALNQPAEAARAIAQAEQAPEMTADDLSNLGIALMKMNQPARALQALAKRRRDGAGLTEHPLQPGQCARRDRAVRAGRGNLSPLPGARADPRRSPHRSRHRARGDRPPSRCHQRVPGRGPLAAQRSGRPRRSEESRGLAARSPRTLKTAEQH